MSTACPISSIRVDERTARTNAFVTIAFMALGVLTPWHWLTLVLALDLLVRGFVDPRLSVVSKVTGHALRMLKVKPNPVNAGPKMFAGKVACFFAAASGVSFAVGAATAGYVFGGILIFCACLEGILGFCLACWMYSYLPERLQNLVGTQGTLVISRAD